MAKVRIYKDAGYSGSYQELGPGRHNSLTIGNDQVSSVEVPPGWKATLWWDTNFSGGSRILTASTDYVGSSWNDETTAVTVSCPVSEAPLDTPGSLALLGAGAYVDLGPVSIAPQGGAFAGFTVEAWVYFDSIGAWGRILDLSQTPGADSIILCRHGTGSSLFFSVYKAGVEKYLSVPSAIANGQWMHVAATLDASGYARIFVNGKELGTGAQLHVPEGLTRSSSYVGRSGGSGGFFAGQLAEVRLWSVARTGAEISRLMNSRLTGTEQSLLRYLRLDEAAGSVARDLSGNRDAAIVTTGGAVYGLAGPTLRDAASLPTGIQLDGSTDHLILPPLATDFGKGFTIEAWVYYDDTAFAGRVVDLGSGPGIDNILLARAGSSGDLHCAVHIGTSAGSVVGAIGVLQTGTWLHLAATLSPSSAGATTGTLTIYVNGVNRASGQLPMPRSGVTRTRCYVGKSNWSGDALFKGRMAEVRLWTVARTQDELLAGMRGPLTGEEPGLAAYYRLNEAGETVAHDASPNRLHAQLAGSTVWGKAMEPDFIAHAPPAQALLFDGTSAHVALPPLDESFARGFTIEAWVYFEDAARWARIIDLGGSSGVNNIYLARAGTSSDLCLVIYDSSAGELRAAGAITTGTWMHVAVTMGNVVDGSPTATATIYVNGIVRGSGPLPVPRAAAVRTSSFLGKSNGSGDEMFRGRMAEVRIWTVARTKEEIRGAMNRKLAGSEPGLSRYYALDEGTGGLSLDSVAPANTARAATIVGTAQRQLALPPRTTAGAIGLDGADDQIQLPALDADLSCGFTIEAWVYFDTASGGARIVELGQSAGLDTIALDRDATGQKLVLSVARGSAATQVLSSAVLMPGQWTHVAATLSAGGSAVLYVNGRSVGTRSGIPLPSSGVIRSLCYAGRSSTGTPARLRGRMADLRIWTLPRSATDIADGMETAPSGDEPGLCRLHPLDEASGSRARDRARKDGTFAAGAEWAGLPHKSALLFDGNTHVQIPALAADFSQGFTIEAWVLFTSTSSYARIVDLGRGSALDNIILCRSGTSTRLYLALYNSSGGITELTTDDGAIPLEQWIHVAATLDASRTATIYVNGESQASERLSFMPTAGVTRTLAYIGKSNWPQDALLKGRISELRIFTTCRSAEDIQAMMRRPLADSEAELCRSYRLDDAQGTVARDSSQAGAHATVYGPLVRPSMVFDGVNDYVQLPAIGSGLTPAGFTLEAWVFPTANDSWGRIIELATKPGLGGQNISLSRAEGGTDVALRIFREGTSAVTDLRASGALPLNTWTHIAVTLGEPAWDAAAADTLGQAAIYVNGEQKASARVRAPSDANRTSSFIGRLDGYPLGSYMFRGRMAEVRIWRGARTPDQIRASRDAVLSGTEPGLFRYYRLNDAAGATVRDSAAAPTPATVFGASARSGLLLNGSTDYVALPALSADFSKGFTIQAWVYVTRVDKYARILDLGNGQATDNIVLARYDTSDKLTLVIYNGSSYSQVLSQSALVLGKWTHVAVTVSAVGAVAYYVNGAAAGTGTLTQLSKSGITRTRCYAGKSNWSVDPLFSGRMAELALFTRVRTAAEISASMGSGLTGSEAGLLHCYRLDDGLGPVLPDRSASGRAAFLLGTQSETSQLRPDARALCFDGRQGAASLPVQTATLSQGFTLEAWAFFSGTPKADETLAHLGGGSFGDTITLRRAGTTDDLVLACARDTTEQSFTFASVLRSEMWMHLCVTVSAASGSAGARTATLYLNGVQVGDGAPTAVTAEPGTPVSRLGMNINGSGPLSGRLTEVRLWSTPRSAAQIAGALSARAQGDEPGLLRYYPLSDIWGRAARDGIKHSDATISGNPLRFARPLGRAVPPMPVGALQLDGVRTYVALPLFKADLSAGFTLEAWVYFDDKASGARIIELGRGEKGELIALGRSGSTGRLTLEVSCENQVSSLTTGSDVITQGTWIHVAASVSSAGAASLCVNGTEVATGTVQVPSAGVARARSYLGKSSGTAALFKGRIAEVRIWSRARTVEEIKGAKGQSLSRDDASLVACYRLDELEGTVVHDASNAGLDAVLKGMKPVWGAPAPQLLPAPHVPGALAFDGANDWIALPALPASFSQGFTIEAWVLFADNARMARIVDLGTGPAGDNILLARADTSQDLILQVFSGSSGPTEVRAAGVLQIGTFMHIAAVCSATGAVTLYVNGAASANGSVPLPRSVSRGSAYIGKSNWSGDALFRGRMLEVRLWSIARSQEELRRTMNMRLRGSEPGLVADYRLNESSGERAGDSSRSGLHAWARGTASWDGSAPLPNLAPASDAAKVLRLDGTTAVKLPAIEPLPNQIVPAGICLEAFVYCNEVTQAARFIDLGNSATASDNLYLGKSGSDLVLGVQVGTAAVQVVTAKAVLTSQQWIHVAASVDENGHVVLCKNGAPLAPDSNLITPPALVVRSDAFIGRSLSGVMFNGRMTEARIFTTPRTPRQISDARLVRLGSEAPGLLRCYPLLAPRGTIAADTAPQHKDGTVLGPAISWDIAGPDFSGSLPAPPSAPPSGALAFDGASTYVRLPEVSTDLSKGFTLEAWALFLGRDTWARIVDIGQGMRLNNVFLARYTTTDRLALRIYYNGDSYTEITTLASVLPLGSWVHLAATLGPDGRVAIYVNGVSVALSLSQVQAASMPPAGIKRHRAYLGKSNWYWDAMFRGRMAEVRLWNRARTAEEIQLSRSTRLTGTERGLFGYYRLDEQSGTVAASRSTVLGNAEVFGDCVWGSAAPALGAEPPMPVPTRPLTTTPPSGVLSVPSGPSTGWGAGITTGDSLVDTAITTYAQTGVSFDLFGVTTALTLGGSISFIPLSQTVRVTGTLTLTRPASLPGVTGTLTINKGTSPPVYSARFKPAFSVSQMVHDAAAGTAAGSVVDALLVPPLRAFDGCTILVASNDGYDSDLGDFGKGINFYMSQKVSDLPGISLLPDKWKIDLLKLDQRALVLAIGVRSPTEYRFSGRAVLDIPLIPGSDFRLTFNEIGLDTLVSPTSSSFGIAHRFTLDLLGESLVFQGGIAVEKGSTGEDIVVWGALDPDENSSADGKWHNPFGCPGVVIDGLGVQLKLTDRPPFLGIGLRGGVHIGDGLLGASVALNIDPANADDTILVIESPEGIDLPRLIGALLDVTRIPGLGILSDLLDVQFKDLRLYFAPNGGTIAGKDYDAGISIGATLDLWGYHASLFGCLDTASGGTLKGSADRIKIDVGSITLVQLSDLSGSSGPNVDIQLNTSRQGVYYSGRLLLLGGLYDKYQELSVTSSGIYLKCPTDLGTLELTCKSSGVDLVLSPRFVFSFSVLGLSVHIDIGATIENRVDASGYTQSLSFWFHALGVDFSLGPVTWGITLTDLESMLRVFERFFGDMVKSLFTDVLGQALKEAFDWVKNNLTDLAEEAVEIFKSAGAAIADIAKNVFETYDVAVEELIGYLGTGLNEAASILKGILGDAAEAAKVLGAAFGVAASAVKSALIGVGYDIGGVAEDVWGAIDDAAGYLDPTSW